MQLLLCPRAGSERLAMTKPYAPEEPVYCCEFCVDLDYPPKDGTEPRTEHTEFCERQQAERSV